MRDEQAGHPSSAASFEGGPGPVAGSVPMQPARGSLRSLRVVAIGGGTGLPVVLRGLKRALQAIPRDTPEPSQDRLTAIVTVADDGGSSGRLRRAYGGIAPGDVRNCLLALSEGGVMTTLFGFRFAGCDGLGGHSLGNLILTALSQLHGDFPTAVERAGEILAVSGRVLAATTAEVSLEAELQDGRRVRGECAIREARGRIRRLQLEPEHAAPLPAALEALREASLVVIGPGSLYTSLLPPLLVKGIPEAIAASGARVVLVMNLMGERGETDGLTAADHVQALRRHAPWLPVHDVLLNSTPIPDEAIERYASEGALPVDCSRKALEALGCRPLLSGLLGDGPKLRHDPRALAAALLEIALGARVRPGASRKPRAS